MTDKETYAERYFRERGVKLAAPPVAEPEWQEPIVSRVAEALPPLAIIWSVCGCGIVKVPNRKPEGYHCEAHTFAHLVSGEARLRAAMKGEG